MSKQKVRNSNTILDPDVQAALDLLPSSRNNIEFNGVLAEAIFSEATHELEHAPELTKNAIRDQRSAFIFQLLDADIPSGINLGDALSAIAADPETIVAQFGADLTTAQRFRDIAAEDLKKFNDMKKEGDANRLVQVSEELFSQFKSYLPPAAKLDRSKNWSKERHGLQLRCSTILRESFSSLKNHSPEERDSIISRTSSFVRNAIKKGNIESRGSKVFNEMMIGLATELVVYDQLREVCQKLTDEKGQLWEVVDATPDQDANEGTDMLVECMNKSRTVRIDAKTRNGLLKIENKQKARPRLAGAYTTTKIVKGNEVVVVIPEGRIEERSIISAEESYIKTQIEPGQKSTNAIRMRKELEIILS